MNAFFKLSRTVYLFLVGLALVYFIQADRYFGYTSKLPKNTTNITSDGTAYYAYLPQYVVYPNEPHFRFIEKVMPHYPGKNINSMLEDYGEKRTHRINKFYIGTALLQFPFYLTAHGIIKLTNELADGYSRGYRFSVQIAALFWFIIGVIAFIHFLKSFGVSDLWACFCSSILALGTNLNTYTVYCPTMSHVYSFGILSLFLMIVKKWVDVHCHRCILWIALLLGVAVIIRPVNGLIVFIIPFLFPDFKTFLERLLTVLKTHTFFLLASFGIFASILLIQLFIHYDLEGEWSFYTYGNEGFDNWKNPKIIAVLLSSQKGFFVYGPVLLLLFPAIYYLYKNSSRYFFFGWFFSILFVVYVISSWWDWAYGGGLGMRPLIEFLPLFMIPIASMFKMLTRWRTYLVIVFSILATIQFQFFQYQFNHNILPYSNVTWSQLGRIKWNTAHRFDWMFYYDNDTIPKNISLKRIATSTFTGVWKINTSIPHIIFDSNAFTLFHLVNPIYGKLSGNVRIHNPDSNPAIYIDYYKKGEKIRSSVQTIGNQVEQIHRWTFVKQEYCTNDFDSLSLKLETFGHSNDYRNFRIDWFEKYDYHLRKTDSPTKSDVLSNKRM